MDGVVVPGRRRARALLPALALFAAACAPELNWREWRAEGSRVVQMFPCKPVQQQRRLQLAGRELQFVLQVCDAGGVAWAQARVDVQDPAAVELVMQALAAAAHANLGTPPAAAAAPAVAGATPQQASGRFVLAGKGPDGRPLEQAMLLFATGTVVVQVTALGTRLPAAAVDTFLGSVHVRT
ncbi:hypothetical protein [Pseudorhodoferax sp.]|uniref:hypothetical protein n=1 Tax=Pseudorhodoferax sp. TaxID=1993553 RepID=UPI002DD649D9|nr:hypothetical protein [Pseudorhodoferax sp.]